jgi:MFS transporter, PHS family, inorganic phosphate transporter
MVLNGLLAAEMAAAIAGVLGLVITLTMLPETKGKSLEELSAEDEASLVAFAPASS